MGARFVSILAALLLVSASAAAERAGLSSIPPVKPAVPATAQLAAPPAAGMASSIAVIPPLKPTMLATATMAGGIAVRLDAIIAPGGKPIADTISWTVAKLEGEVVASQTAAQAKFALAPGKYKVTVEYGHAKSTHDLVVGTSAGKQTFNLNAGYLTVKMIPHSGAPAIKDDVTWELYVYAGGKAENGTKLSTAVAPTQSYVLPAGAYVVRAQYEGTSADLVVPLAAGQGYDYTINLYAGILDARAVKPSGGDLTGEVRWEILRAKPDQDGHRQVVGWFIGPKHKFTLREGAYIVVARASNMSTMEPFEIKAGKVKKLKLVLKPGVDQAPVGKVPAAASG